MPTTLKTQVRELDHRRNDGVDVTLLWNPQRRRVSVAVKDERSGESLEFEVDSADALAAFHHPYAYADAPPHSLSRGVRPERGSDGPQARAA